MRDTTYIAIVDDHTMFRKGLKFLIDSFPGYKVLLEAGNGKELIDKLKPPHLPDIALIDITMPQMDGYSTASWLNVNYPEVSIIALSTMDAETAIIKMIRHGARGYVLKDAEPSELRQAFYEVSTKGYFYNEVITRKVMGSIDRLVRDNDEIAGFVKLTEKELEFIHLACSEKTYAQIAEQMCLSERTIDGYRESVFRKLDLKTRVG